MASLKVKGQFDIWQGILNVCYFFIGLDAFLTCNTLWSNLRGRYNLFFTGTLFIAMCAAIILLWLKTRLRHEVVRATVLWSLFVLLCYLVMWLTSRSVSSAATLLYFMILALGPLLFSLLDSSWQTERLLRCYIAITVAFAITSLALWLIGPLANVIQPNCTIEDTWNGLEGVVWHVNGYYDLLYMPQLSSDISFLPGVVRNTSIFTEAPMYSFALCCALLYELFLMKHPRRWIIVLLFVSVYTSVSTTGLVVATSAVFLRWLIGASKKIRNRAREMIVVFALAMVTLVALFQVVKTKSAGLSVSIRQDDFVAGFKTWIISPLWGNGFDCNDLLVSHMSLFRMGNIGFSNSLMSVLACGGLLFLSLVIVAFAGFLRMRNTKAKVFGFIFALMWVFTIATYMPLAGLVLARGVAYLCEEASGGGWLRLKKLLRGGCL